MKADQIETQEERAAFARRYCQMVRYQGVRSRTEAAWFWLTNLRRQGSLRLRTRVAPAEPILRNEFVSEAAADHAFMLACNGIFVTEHEL
jgi:hypothetical protein